VLALAFCATKVGWYNEELLGFDKTKPHDQSDFKLDIQNTSTVHGSGSILIL